MSEQFWAGANDDQEGDYDEVEDPENEEMEDEEDQDESDEEEEDEVPKPIKPKGKIKTTTVASPIAADPVHPKDIIFVVPCRDQYGQDLAQKVPIPLITTADAVISTLQGVIGSLKLPASKHPPLVVKLNKSGTPWLVLNTAQDWEQLKSDWMTDYGKKKILIEVSAIVSKKMLKDIKEAARKYMGVKKKPMKKVANPYLSSDSENEDGGPDDGKDLKIEHGDDCMQKQHHSMVCLGDKAKSEHFLVSCVSELAWVLALVCDGIDLENPPHTDAFKDWYFKPSNLTSLQRTPDQHHRASPSSGSAHSTSPVLSPNTPDVGTWLSDLRMLTDIPSINWNKLTTKFESEDYLVMLLHSLAAFTFDLMCTGFGMTIQELSVVTEQLKKAAKQYGFMMKADMGKSCGNSYFLVFCFTLLLSCLQ
ncbi:hypothetical protein K439DRAFT_1622175 [Ramaria rubella]|nr:hypothetical protein K439DRAFT_1622175 [Ramaria rubella]